MTEKLRQKVKILKDLGLIEQKLDRVYAGENTIQRVYSKEGAMTPNGANWNLEEMKFDTEEEMFQGADAIYLNLRWYETRMLRSDGILPQKQFEERLKKELEKVSNVEIIL